MRVTPATHYLGASQTILEDTCTSSTRILTCYGSHTPRFLTRIQVFLLGQVTHVQATESCTQSVDFYLLLLIVAACEHVGLWSVGEVIDCTYDDAWLAGHVIILHQVVVVDRRWLIASVLLLDLDI